MHSPISSENFGLNRKEHTMGPLVPEVIGNELNFVVALIVGIGFGFALEQAGFSTSKKLVGLFYGYDFTVLRVFFTAGVTAMIGVIALVHFGLLDMSLVYVNPTFIWSALVGGLIMGLGFVIGGFCPGTSVCAAAIGKIDAMIFLAGSFFGVLLFAEGYPVLEGLYKAVPWGNVTIFSVLGMSQAVFAFLMVCVAVGAFWAVTYVETKVNKKRDPHFQPTRRYVAFSGLAVMIGLTAFFLPDKRQAMLVEIADKAYVASQPVKLMSSDELAFRLIDEDKNLQIFDFRSPKEYAAMSLPQSIRMTLQSLFEKDANALLSLKKKRTVFLANDQASAQQAAVIAMGLGHDDVFVLKDGLTGFKNEILNFTPSMQQSGPKLADTYRFRTKASQTIPMLIQENQKKQGTGTKKASKRVIGGC
jgi:rhodanese-related sulfurtransferase